MKILSLFLVLILALPSFARDYHSEIVSSLKYLERQQVDHKGDYEPGEWTTEVSSIMLPSLVGVGIWGKPYPEATVFTTASIVDILQDLYEKDPQLKPIPDMVTKAIEGFGPFIKDDFFNFYPLRRRNGAWVRGPRGLYLAPYFRGLANVPPDADSNSMAYYAMRTPAPEKVLQSISRFRDVNRDPHWYNRRCEAVNTGGFLTWLMDEKDPNMSKRFHSPERGSRIPFGTNDVDCVVNANVLKLLIFQKRTEMPGYKEACEWMRTLIVRKDFGRCGSYYPSDYLLPLRIAELQEMGARKCLNGHEPRVLKFILETQSPEGWWENDLPNRKDRVHSTVLALNTLALMGDPNSPDHQKRIDRAVKFLMRNARKDSRGNLYWKGEVYFSAVAIARYSIVWRSSPYTTALAIQALQRAERF
jgi:hypothetical protein